MKLLFLLIIFTTATRAQDVGFSPHDCLLNAVGLPTVNQPCTVAYSDVTMPYPTLRYGYGGVSFSYHLNFPVGPAFLTLSFSEPTKINSSQRLFTYKVNNLAPVQIDVFKLSGGLKKKLDVTIPILVDVDGVNILFTAQIGNAIINKIQLTQLLVDVKSPILSWLTCPSGSCQGIQYLKLSSSTGNKELIAVPPDHDVSLQVQSWGDSK